MASYLWLRGRTWFFQVRPPNDLQVILGKTPFRARLPCQSQRDASRFARRLIGSAERWFEAMRYTDRGLKRLGAFDFHDDPNLSEDDRRTIESRLRKPFIDSLLAEVRSLSLTAAQYETYERIKAEARPDDRVELTQKQAKVFQTVNEGWNRFAARVIEDFDAAVRDMQHYRTSHQRTTQKIEDLQESHYDNFLTWKEELSKAADEARNFETEAQEAHEAKTEALEKALVALQNSNEVTGRLLNQGPKLSECWMQFVHAKRRELPSESTEPRYFEHWPVPGLDDTDLSEPGPALELHRA